MIRRTLVWALAVVAAGAVAGVIWFLVAGNVGDPTEVTAPLITSESPMTISETAAAGIHHPSDRGGGGGSLCFPGRAPHHSY